MNNNLTGDDNLPPGWVEKPSKSRPHLMYYYNTATKETQWKRPISHGNEHRTKSTKKEPAQSPKENGKSDGNSFKISNHSKQIKKRISKTPAQERLQNVVTQLKNASPTKHRSKNVAEQLKNATPAQSRLHNQRPRFESTSERMNGSEKIISRVDFKKSDVDNLRSLNSSSSKFDSEPIVRKPDTPYKGNIGVDFNKSRVDGARSRDSSSNKPQLVPTVSKPHASRNSDVAESTDDIPTLFPPRTPGQNRLDRLRDSLNPGGNGKQPANESAQQVLRVIQSEFGLPPSSVSAGNNQSTSSVDEDEPMDWEPCDIFEEVENVVWNETIRSYIIPDTNVFLDELSCIRETIHGRDTYNVLVPFVVLQELDRLKSRSGDTRIPNLASGAIRFIYNELKSKNQRLQGQKATEDCIHLIDVLNADDKILNCCLQALRHSRETVLISNDINLCNKAIASGITTMTSKEYRARYH